jgi:hypothetical protein
MERDSIRENRGSSIKAARIRALASKGRYGEEEDDRARCAVTKASLGWGGAASGGSGGKVRAMRSLRVGGETSEKQADGSR